MARGVGSVLAAAAVVALALPAGAAPASEPDVVDPRGDWPVAAQDIVAATFSTAVTPSGKVLQIRLELAGPPTVDAGLYWEVGWSAPGCGLYYIEYTRSAYGPGDESAELIRRCDPDGPAENGFPATGRLEGSTVLLTTPLAGRFPRGARLTEPYAASFTFVITAGVGTHREADVTARGRTYRVGQG